MSASDEAIDFLRLVTEAESANRQEALEDLKFRFGDQWPLELMNSRQLESRPCFTINEIDSYCRQVTNQIRQQRPRIKVHPVNGKADEQIAKVITGLVRHIEVNSDADNAYDTASDHAVTFGWGYWRVTTNYVRENSFDQEIYINPVENPFTVYFDPNSSLPDGSDAERCLITDVMTKKEFEFQFPGAESNGFINRGSGDVSPEWVTKEDIRIAEFFKVQKVKDTLILLSNNKTFWEDELPPPEMLEAARLTVTQQRDSYRRKVKWSKVSAFETLEEGTWAGRWIPIVPIYGSTFVNEGKRKHFGLVRFARDPQRLINFWQTNITEMIALGPKAKWMMAEGQDEGHEMEWAKANVSAASVLRYKQRDVDGSEAPAPQRIQPEPPPPGAIEAAALASQNLQRVVGMFDPAIRSNREKSGKALVAEQQQSDLSNFQFFDNMTRSQKHTGRIFLDLTRSVYDTQRVMRIIGEDGKADLVTLNERTAIGKVLNDVTVGDYDVTMDTGPGYNSKRQEAQSMFVQLLGGPLGEKIANVGADLVVRSFDIYGMDALADRLEASNPLAQIDEKSDVPPLAQMQIKQLQEQLQKAHQLLQQAGLELKFKTGIEQGWMKTELEKEKIRSNTRMADSSVQASTKRHDVETIAATKRHDTETRALTAQHVEELKGLVQLLLSHLDTKRLEKEIELTEAKSDSKASEDNSMSVS